MTPRKRRLVSAQTKIALLLAFGAGFGAVQIQPHEAPLRALVVAFLAASLPVLAMHWSHSRANGKAATVEPTK